MRKIGAVLSVAVGLLGCATTTAPVRLATVATQTDPQAESVECRAAAADAGQFSEQLTSRAFKGFLMGLAWPFTMGKPQELDHRKAVERHRYMERIRVACFTQPPFERAPPVSGQRWPETRNYLKSTAFMNGVGGRSIVGYAHASENTIWLKQGPGAYDAEWWTGDDWTRAAAWLIAPTGCRVAETRMVISVWWEVSYVCPAGVDLRALMKAQQASIWAGGQVQPDLDREQAPKLRRTGHR
jgi:hypothetical protein